MGLRQTFRDIRLVAQGAVPIDAERPLKDQIEDMTTGINAFIKSHQLAGAALFMGFPSSTALWREIELPSAAGENLSETLRYEAEKYFPLPPDEIYLDYQVVATDRAAGRIKVLVTVVKRGDLEPFIDLAARLDAVVVGASPGLCALAHLRQHHPQWCPGEAAAFVIKTPTGLQMARFSNGALRAARVVAGVVPDARRLRSGLQSVLSADGDVDDTPPGPVFFSGEDLTEETVREWLPDAPERKVLPIDFDGTLAADADPAAVGLALRNLIRPKLATNLLPREVRRRPSRASLYALAGATALVLLALLAWGGGQVMARRIEQGHLEAEINRISGEVAHIDQMQAEIEALRRRIDYLRPGGSMPLPALDVLNELTGLIPDTAWLRELDMNGEAVKIDGYGDNVSELISLIDASPRFTEVRFLSAITRGRDGKEKFRIGFRLAHPPGRQTPNP